MWSRARARSVFGLFGWLTVLLLVAAWSLAGCSTSRRERLLAALFDDPPPTQQQRRQAEAEAEAARLAEEAAMEAARLAGAQRPRRTRWEGSTHGPYGARLCAACHSEKGENPADGASMARLRYAPRDLCVNCHQADSLVQHTANESIPLHGPVAAGECAACHFPHRSREPFLLRAPAAELCASCHQTESLLDSHPDRGERACITCHDAHAPLRTTP